MATEAGNHIVENFRQVKQLRSGTVSFLFAYRFSQEPNFFVLNQACRYDPLQGRGGCGFSPPERGGRTGRFCIFSPPSLSISMQKLPSGKGEGAFAPLAPSSLIYVPVLNLGFKQGEGFNRCFYMISESYTCQNYLRSRVIKFAPKSSKSFCYIPCLRSMFTLKQF